MLGEMSCGSCGNMNRVWEVVQWNEMTRDRKVWRLRAEKFRE